MYCFNMLKIFLLPQGLQKAKHSCSRENLWAGNVLEITQMPELLQGKEQTYLLNSRIKGSTKGLEQEQWLSVVGVAEEWWRECLPLPPSSVVIIAKVSHCYWQKQTTYNAVEKQNENRATTFFLFLGPVVSRIRIRVLMIPVRKIKVATFIDPGQAHPTKSQIEPQIEQI